MSTVSTDRELGQEQHEAPAPAATGPRREAIHSLRSVFTQFWPYTAGQRWRLARGTVLVVLAVPLEAAAIWLFKVLADQVLQPGDFAPFPAVAAAYAGLTAAIGVIAYLASVTLARAGQTFVLVLRTKVFGHLHGLSMDYF